MSYQSVPIAGLVLGAFAVAGVSLVALTHAMVDGRIADNQQRAMQRKLDTILPPGRFDNDPLQDHIEVQAPELLGAERTRIYPVRKGRQPVALILEPVVPNGYAGPIKLLVSVLRDGRLGGVRVVSHHETPGLGDKIEEGRSDWILSFTGKSLADPPAEKWAVKRDGGAFDQFTGATITPRSIVAAVKNTLIYVEQQDGRLFAPPTGGSDTLATGERH
jgi:Na+-translocating ferredoxin:NAD+ oxidoreductase subunit G